jgi:C4-dicarboxylate-binding protein DctP
MKIKNLLMVVTLMLMMLLAACGGTEDIDTDEANGEEESSYSPMTIIFSHNQPLESPEHAGAAKFKEIVEERSEGQITVELHPASQLGSLREQVEATQMGEINITMQPSAVITPFVDDIKVIDLPYLWPSSLEEKYAVQDSEVGTEILDTLEVGGFKGLGYWPGGFKLFTSNKEIHTPDDFKGVTIRVMESPLLIKQYQTWGANPVPVPYAELYNALQQGIVDGQENPLQTIFLNNYHEVQDNVIESFHGTMTYILMANKNWFDELPAEVQEIIGAAEEEGKVAARQSLADKEDGYKQEIIDSGVNFYKLTDEEIEKFIEVTKPVHKEMYDKPHQLELLEKLYEEINKVVK